MIMNNDTITTTRETLGDDAETLKKDVDQMAQDIKKHATAHVDFVKDKASNSLQRAGDYARENPLYVVGGAFALGFFMGLIRRK